MPYGVEWAPAAEADFAAIADSFPLAASQVLDFIDRLAADPIALSRRSTFPYPQMQLAQLWIDVDEQNWLRATVLFQFLPGERDIVIRFIGRSLIEKSSGYGPP